MACFTFILFSSSVLYFTRVKGEANDTIDSKQDMHPRLAENLLRLGRRTKSPLIQLLGRSIDSIEKKFDGVKQIVEDAEIERQINKSDRIETNLKRAINETEHRMNHVIVDRFDILVEKLCSMYTCTEWSEWTKCDAETFFKYGLQNRTRECGKGASFCQEGSESKSETESVLCQSKCPERYIETPSKYCVKLYKSMQLKRDDAEIQCQKDGGHLIVIDSASKSDDVTDILKKERPDRVWIDGIQRSYGKEWKLSSGSTMFGYTNWEHDQPNGNTYPNCMYLLPPEWLWADYPCYYKYNFMCEISYN